MKVHCLSLLTLLLMTACGTGGVDPSPSDGGRAPEDRMGVEDTIALQDVPLTPDLILPDIPLTCSPGGPCLAGPCHEAPYALECVSGTVGDEAGAPLADQPVVICAAEACFSGRSDTTGWFSIPLPEGTLVDHMSLYFPGFPLRHTPFCLYRGLCDGAAPLCDPFRLYMAPATGMAVPEGELDQSLTVTGDDGARLIFPPGSEVRIPLGYDDWVALSRFPLEEHRPCFIDPARLPQALYVVTPLDTMVIVPGTRSDPILLQAALDLPNEGLAPGTEVEIYALGGLEAPMVGMVEGEWIPWTRGRVTDDGARIITEPGQGLGYLTWFAVYPL